MDDGETFRTALAEAKGASIAHLLVRTARLINEVGIRRVQADPRLRDARAAHLSVFPHLDLDGTRLTELARRMGVTKQAVSQIIDELEAMKVVERQPDPDDRRAKLVVFTPEGRGFLLDGLAVLQSVDDDVLAMLSTDRQRRFKEDLVRLMASLERLSAEADTPA